jgi:hypothetical protein
MADIITLQEYEDFDGMTSPYDSDEQSVIEQAIDNATAFIEDETGGRTFTNTALDPSPTDVVEIINVGGGATRLYVKNSPIQGVTDIEYWDGTQWVQIDSVANPYTFKPGSRIVYFINGYKPFKSWQQWRVTYTYGFDDDFPQKLKWACYIVAKHFKNMTERQGINVQQDGEQNFTYGSPAFKGIPKEALTVIRRFKNYV